MANAVSKQRLLIFIVAYNAEKTIADLLSRLSEALAKFYDVSVLVIDDVSHDKTFERGHAHSLESGGLYSIKVIFGDRCARHPGTFPADIRIKVPAIVKRSGDPDFAFAIRVSDIDGRRAAGRLGISPRNGGEGLD